jgi:DNA-binding response OmpR family regulator
MKILIAEDDNHTREALREVLCLEGFDVLTAGDGLQAVDLFRATRPDFVCLDVMMPGQNGYEVCKQIRRMDERVPILFLTAKAEEIDTVLGLELGADDYVTKPFALDELLARVHAVLRRTQPHPANLRLGEITFDFQRMSATRGGKPLSLTDRELAVIRRLAERVGHVVSRDELLRIVWGYVDTPVTRTVDNLIVRLRRKIEPDPKQPRFIRTAHGDGYRLTPDG